MSTFVIVHGAWAWSRVTGRLRAEGHRVHVPTLSGLGERLHLAHLPITLATHIEDVVNEIVFNDLTEIALVMHSYGGIVGAGVVERIRQRIASLVFVDAFVPAKGESFSDLMGGWAVEGHLTPSPPTSPGDYLVEADRVWVDAKSTPQPTATLTDRLKLTGAYLTVPKKTFVVATGWNGFSPIAARFRNDPTWNVQEIKCGHDVAIDMPDELSALLKAEA